MSADPAPAPPAAPPARSRPLSPVDTRAALRRLARAPEPPWLHGEIARRLGERLPFLTSAPRRVLDWWAWQGQGAAVLQAAFPAAERVPVEPDLAHAARLATQTKPPWWSRRRVREPLLETADDAALGRAQMVFAVRALDLVADPAALIGRWARLLDVDGVLLVAGLGPGSFPELRAIAADEGTRPPAPPFVDMHDLGDLMVEAGFVEPVFDQETIRLTWADGRAALAELATWGGHLAPTRFAGLRTPRWRDRLAAALDARRGADGRVALTVELAYGHGFLGRPRPAPGEPVAVSLDAMRDMLRRPGRRDAPD
jgi:malonyl-CoA O-methyltransferase